MIKWQQWVIANWYSPYSWMSIFLMPLAFIYQLIIMVRQWYYRYYAAKAVTYLNVPVIVVGNLTVGGTGKTPLVIWLAQFLQQHGYRPGIISRGYKAKSKHYPQMVTKESDAELVGDEALLLAQKTHCPVVIAPKRVKAAKFLLGLGDCNVIISDDGLQHYALARDIEIVVIDGDRRFGNEKCLPAGPLREPLSRLKNIDFKVTNGVAQAGEFAMQLIPGTIYNLQEPEITADVEDFRGQILHAVAGIGHPERFFNQLCDLRLTILPHRFPDHYFFEAKDFQFEADAKIIMTEKDAVKCKHLIDFRYWCLPVSAQVDDALGVAILKKLQQFKAKKNV